MSHDDHRESRTPDEVQPALTPRELELEIQLTHAEAAAEKVKAEAEQAKIAAFGEMLRVILDSPGPKAALEGLGAAMQAQAAIEISRERHGHDQLMQDKRDAETQRERDWKKA